MTHADVALSVTVPAAWSHIEDSRWRLGGRGSKSIGQALVVSPEANVPMVEHTSGWHAPGVFVGLSDTLLKDSGVSTKDSIAFEMEFARMVSGVDHGQYAASCDYKGVSNVGTEVFDIALRRLWTGCAKGKFTVADLWAADADSGQLVYAIAVVPGRADVEAADRVLTSVRFQDTAVMDLS